jgi:hypothetical protein
MNPKLIFFKDFYINMSHVVSILSKPSKVTVVFADASSMDFVDFDESEYKALQESLQYLM